MKKKKRSKAKTKKSIKKRTSKKKTKNLGGRPSSYDPIYCEMIIKHMEKGLSITAFAGVIDVNKDTLYEWKKIHPEFSDAIKKGVAKSLYTWETMGISGILGKIKGFNVAGWIYNMKVRFHEFGWRDDNKEPSPQWPPPSVVAAIKVLDERKKK